MCGDGVCDMANGETSATCPGDCQTQGMLDCQDHAVLLQCFACLLDETSCVPPVTVDACTLCIMT
jgi:hypothetical protein